MRHGTKFAGALIAVLLWALLPAAPAMAQTNIVVTDGGDGPPNANDCNPAAPVANSCSLRDALAFGRGAGGTVNIDFAASVTTITLTVAPADTNTDDPDTGDLDVVGTVNINPNGNAQVTIDASGLPQSTNSRNSRVFDIRNAGGDTTVTLNNLTITGGDVGGIGGGLRILENSHQTSVTITNSVIDSNRADDGGGGIFADNDVTTTITQTTISNNQTDGGSGGGLSAGQGGFVILTNVLVSGNGGGATAPRLGGGAEIRGSFAISDSLFTGNTASERGGGLFGGDADGPLESGDIFTSTFSANTVQPITAPTTIEGGGGIFLGAGIFTITNSTITGNTAPNGGGLMANSGGNTTDLVHVTVADNTATIAGAATEIAAENVQDPAFVQLFNSVVEGSANPACSGLVLSQGGNSNPDATCGNDGENGDDTNDSQLAALATNSSTVMAGDQSTSFAVATRQGGATPPAAQIVPTRALPQGSPAVDTGNTTPTGGLSATCGQAPIATDQRGISRPQDGNADGTTGCDRGAFERVATTTPPAPIPGPTIYDIAVDKTGPMEADTGVPFDFTITVSNEGPNTVPDATLTDTLPSGLNLQSASAPCTTSGDSITCTFGSLAPGDSVTVTVTATSDKAAAYTNTAQVSTTVAESDLNNNTDSHTIDVILETARIEGPERITTAIDGSQSVFGDGEAGAVVLTRSDLFADAQTGTPLAVNLHAPLLLSQPESLNTDTEAEILRVLPPGGDVYLLGGTAALSEAVEARLLELGFNITRYGGANRFGTAAIIAEEGLDHPTNLLIADGGDFPASVIAGAAAVNVDAETTFAQIDRTGLVNGAVLLTSDVNIPVETQAYLDARPDDPTLYAIGDFAHEAFPDVEAVTAEDRYELSVAVAERFVTNLDTIGVATGENFADALTGGVITNTGGAGPILLSRPDGLPDPLRTYAESQVEEVTRALIFGGIAALSPAVEDELNEALGIT